MLFLMSLGGMCKFFSISMLCVWINPQIPTVLIMSGLIIHPCSSTIENKGVTFVLFGFDGLVCEFVIYECKFYYFYN